MFCRVHIIGMCGKATAPLAAELVRLGYVVTGSDAHSLPPVSHFIDRLGLDCRKGYHAQNVPPDADIILAGSLCRDDNPEVRRAKELGIPVSNFARFLGREFLSRSRNAVVAGSFGKTTTTAMLAMIVRDAGLDPGWLVGGDSPDLPAPVHLRSGGCWVLEGDEYPSGFGDSSPKFRHYLPHAGVITSLDLVHQNKIPSLEATVELMAGFVSSVRGPHPCADRIRFLPPTIRLSAVTCNRLSRGGACRPWASAGRLMCLSWCRGRE